MRFPQQAQLLILFYEVFNDFSPTIIKYDFLTIVFQNVSFFSNYHTNTHAFALSQQDVFFKNSKFSQFIIESSDSLCKYVSIPNN